LEVEREMREKEGERLRWISEIKARWHSQIALIASKLYVRAWWRIIVLKDVNNCVTNWRRKLHEEVEERVYREMSLLTARCKDEMTNARMRMGYTSLEIFENRGRLIAISRLVNNWRRRMDFEDFESKELAHNKKMSKMTLRVMNGVLITTYELSRRYIQAYRLDMYRCIHTWGRVWREERQGLLDRKTMMVWREERQLSNRVYIWHLNWREERQEMEMEWQKVDLETQASEDLFYLGARIISRNIKTLSRSKLSNRVYIWHLNAVRGNTEASKRHASGIQARIESQTKHRLSSIAWRCLKLFKKREGSFESRNAVFLWRESMDLDRSNLIEEAHMSAMEEMRATLREQSMEMATIETVLRHLNHTMSGPNANLTALRILSHTSRRLLDMWLRERIYGWFRAMSKEMRGIDGRINLTNPELSP